MNAALTDSPTDGLRQNSAGAAMYLGCVLNHPHMCLFADKNGQLSSRGQLGCFERGHGHFSDNSSVSSTVGGHLERTGLLGLFLYAIRFVLRYGLSDFARREDEECLTAFNEPEHQRVGRRVAASFPPLTVLLRKLVFNAYDDISGGFDHEQDALEWRVAPS